MDTVAPFNLKKPGASGTAPPVSELRDALRANTDVLSDLLLALVPVGGMMPWSGAGDPAGGKFLLADGRLISRGTAAGAAFYAVAGHAYNGGVDPGSSMVRLPDKRGRGSIGAANMGTAQGAATGNGRAQVVRGANGGEEKHQLVTGEMPSHSHGGATGGMNRNNPHNHNINLGGASIGSTAAASNGTSQSSTGIVFTDINHEHAIAPEGGGSSHNNLAPFEADNWIVRVL